MCHAAGRGAYARAESVQRLHRQTKTVTSAAYHVFCGHATIIELYLAYCELRGGRTRRYVRPCVWFCQRECRDRFGLCGTRKPEIANVFGRGQAYGGGAQALHDEGKVCER